MMEHGDYYNVEYLDPKADDSEGEPLEWFDLTERFPTLKQAIRFAEKIGRTSGLSGYAQIRHEAWSGPHEDSPRSEYEMLAIWEIVKHGDRPALCYNRKSDGPYY